VWEVLDDGWRSITQELVVASPTGDHADDPAELLARTRQ